MRQIWKLALIAVMGLAVVACSNCGSTPYKRIANAQRSLDHVARFGETIDVAIRDFAQAEDERCTKAHKPKTTEYGECMRPTLKVLWAWTGEKMGEKTGRGALPILQGAQKAARNAIDAAHDYVKSSEQACAGKDPPAKCTPDWKAGIKPSLCAAWELAKVAVKIGAYKATKSAAYQTVAGLAALICGGGS